MTTTRKYVMTRITAGDYILPANDARTLWRVTRYTEDGSAHLDDGTPVVGEFWGVWRWRGTVNDVLDLEWCKWDMWAQGYRTRAEAEAYALAVPAPSASLSLDGVNKPGGGDFPTGGAA